MIKISLEEKQNINQEKFLKQWEEIMSQFKTRFMVKSRGLYDFISTLNDGEKVKFKVWYKGKPTDNIVVWNGERFDWESGSIDSSIFFNPNFEFEVLKKQSIDSKETEEEIKIDKIYYSEMFTNCVDSICTHMNESFSELYEKVDEIIELLPSDHK